MNRDRLAEALGSLRSTGIMAHLVAGYPDVETTLETAKAIEKGGATVLELQFPFSDPLADGSTVLEACQAALEGGLDHDRFLDLLTRTTRAIDIPVVVMTYANIPFTRGFERFSRELADAGATGVIAPDLPHTEREFAELHDALSTHGLSYVPVIAPTSSEATVRELAALARDLLYVVIRLGVTGRESTIDSSVRSRLAEIARITDWPLAAGFGIRSREQVKTLEGHAKLAVVGSHIVETIKNEGARAPREVEKRVRSLLGD